MKIRILEVAKIRLIRNMFPVVRRAAPLQLLLPDLHILHYVRIRAALSDSPPRFAV
jgi:hypothetical protein